MRKMTIAVALLCALTGCRKEPPKEAAKPAPIVAPQAVAEAEAPDAGGPLTVDEVDRYIEYRRTMTAVHRKLLPELDKLDAQAKKAKDAGSVAEAGLKLVGSEAKAQEEARKASGLGQARLSHLDELVQELVTEREMAEDTADPAQIAEMQALAKKSTAEQKAALEKSIANLKAQRDRSMNLTDMRAQYGSADVDTLLKREKELRAAWTDWMSALAGEPK